MEYKHRLLPNALGSLVEGGWGCFDNDFYQIKWEDYVLDSAKPSLEEIKTKIGELEIQETANQYHRDRASAFQSIGIGEQLDMQYWDQVNGTTTWKDAVAKVKSDNPK